MENQNLLKTETKTGDNKGGVTKVAPPKLQNTTNTQAAVVKPKIIKQVYKVIPNKKEGQHHVLPKELREFGGRIGSEFMTKNGTVTNTILRSLTPDQERYFASELLDKTPKDSDYTRSMTEYWENMTIVIPEDGLTLDASYEIKVVDLDGEKVEMEIPLNLSEYIKANFLKNSSRVAFYQEEISNRGLFSFVMEDLSVVERVEADKFKLRNNAKVLYVELLKQAEVSDLPKVDYMLDALKEPFDVFYGETKQNKLMRLETISTEKPEEFVKAFNNPNLEEESLIFRLVQTRVVEQIDDTYYFGDVKLGVKKQFIEFLKDQTKTVEVARMKNFLAEASKKRI
jgi:hypothetical protein